MPAVSALLHPEEARGYVETGHELGMHGWIHERNQQLRRRGRARAGVPRRRHAGELAGVRPVGVRTPSWDFSDATLRIIRELGLLYDSSLMADDEPYEIARRRRADRRRRDSGGVDSRRRAVLHDGSLHRRSGPYTPPRGVLTIWRDEFDRAYAEGGLFQLTMHPHVIGHRSRMVVLEELIDYIRGHAGVWYATHAEIAEYVKRI